MGLFKKAKHKTPQGTIEYTALGLKKVTPENIARTLEHSAKMFDTFGWTQGQECSYDGRVCAIGAIAAALGYQDYHGLSSVVGSDQRDLAVAAQAAVSAVTKSGSIVELNDAWRTKVQNVKARFEKAAREVRDGVLVVDTNTLRDVDDNGDYAYADVIVKRNGRTRRLFS